MALPKLDLPKYSHKLVGSGEKIFFRPFTLKEQKILLLAKNSESNKERMDAMAQIISNCTFGKIDAYKLPLFDIEDLFLRIRSRSVSETAEFKYKVLDDNGEPTGKTIDVSINLDDVKMKHVEDHNKVIMITDSVGIKMKYPTLEILEEREAKESEEDMDDEKTIKNCIESIFDENEVYSDYTDEELDDFLQQLETRHYLDIKKFFDTMPYLYHEVEVNVPDRGKEKLVFQGINDFLA